MSDLEQPDPLLAEQIDYYRAIAPEYEDHMIPGEGPDEILAALDAFQPLPPPENRSGSKGTAAIATTCNSQPPSSAIGSRSSRWESKPIGRRWFPSTPDPDGSAESLGGVLT